jgi:hypothetical protein
MSREAWRWVSFAIPPDLLLSAMQSERGIPQQVDTLSPPLRAMLKAGCFAETHLHVGAGLNFRLLWCSVLQALQSQIGPADFESPGACLNEGRDLSQWLIRTAIVRVLLAKFLADERIVSQDGASVRYPGRPRFEVWFDDFTETMPLEGHAGLRGIELSALLQQVVDDVRTGTLCRSLIWEKLQIAYHALACPINGDDSGTGGGGNGGEPRSGSAAARELNGFQCHDPIAGWFPPASTSSALLQGITPEMRFVAAGLNYLDPPDWLITRIELPSHAEDTSFARLFFQGLRIRCLYYRHIVQRPMTPGLQWFVRAYSRIGSGRRAISQPQQILSAALTSGLGQGLRSLEIRTAPWSDPDEMRQYLETIDATLSPLAGNHGRGGCGQPRGADRNDSDNQADDGSVCADVSHTDVLCGDTGFEYGVVFHLIRERGGLASQGFPSAFLSESHADPQTVPQNGLGTAFENASTEAPVTLRGVPLNSPGRDILEPASLRGPESPERRPSNQRNCRFSTFYRESRLSVIALRDVMVRYPMSLALIRGVDVCTDELGVPLWVMRPLVNHVRQASQLVSAWLATVHNLDIPPIRTTVHAGEDFVHLLGGLRRVEESIRWFGLREGDRIGHGIALGVDARRWAESVGRVPVAREERLLDLVWEWTMYARRQVATTVNRRAFLEREIARLSLAVFDRLLSPYELELLVTALHDDATLQSVGFPNGVPRDRPVNGHDSDGSQSGDASKGTRHESGPFNQRRLDQQTHELLRRYLTDVEIFERGQVSEWVDPASEGETLATLQFQLREQIGSLGITVEVNPSSNLLIANLGDLLAHPLWRLRPPPGLLEPDRARNVTMRSSAAVGARTRRRQPFDPLDDSSMPRSLTADGRPITLADIGPLVPVCIGSDDPLTFATTLPDEYQLLLDTLVLGGLSVDEAREWINDVRRIGLETRFTVPRPAGMVTIRDLLASLPVDRLPVV